MQKILIPIDGSQQSLRAVDLVKSMAAADAVEIFVIMVREDIDAMRSKEELEEARQELVPCLNAAADRLNEYSVKTRVLFGRAGEEILHFAEEHDVDIIAMTKSTRQHWSIFVGSVTTHIVKHAKCIVMIVPDITQK